MPFTSYKGLQRNTASSGAGGVALDQNFQVIADRIGPCNTNAARDPLPTDDSAHGYYKNSRWTNQSTKMIWDCIDDTATAAIWRASGVGMDGKLLASVIPTDFQFQVRGSHTTTVAEVNATPLLDNEMMATTIGGNVYIVIGDGVMSVGGLQVAGNVWPANSLYSHYDPAGSGGLGSGDGTELAATGIIRHKSGVTDAELDSQSQGLGYIRLRGTTDAPNATAPGLGAIDIQTTRAGNARGAAGVTVANGFALGRNNLVSGVGSTAMGSGNYVGATFTDCYVAGVNNAALGNSSYQFGNFNRTWSSSNIVQSGISNDNIGSNNCTFGISSGMGGQNQTVLGINSSADTYSSNAQINALTITAGNVVIAGDFSSFDPAGQTPGSPPYVFLIHRFSGFANPVTNGGILRAQIATAVYNSGAGNTTITFVGNPMGSNSGTAFGSVSGGFISGNTTAVGYQARSLARRGLALGYFARNVCDNLASLTNPLSMPEENGENTGTIPSMLLGTGMWMMASPLVDFTITGTAYGLTISAAPGARFFPLWCGIMLRGQVAGLLTPPTANMGIVGNTSKHRASASFAKLTGQDRLDIALSLTNDGETSLMADVTTAATVSGGGKCKGQFVWIGIMAERWLP
jgi:hypothetical protein